MGTYMSAYIEVDLGGRSPPFSDPMQIFSITEGSFAFDKDYEVFDALADGRSSGMTFDDHETHRAPLLPPRGMPSPCSSAVGWGYFRLVADPLNLPDSHFWPESLCISPEVAAEWLRNGGCHEAEFLQWFNCPPEGRIWRVVSVPKLYNASWLSLDEFDAALEHHGLSLVRLPVEYRIVRAALSLLASDHGNARVRLVIWFR